MALIHEDRRGLLSIIAKDDLTTLKIEGIMRLDLSLCHGDSEAIDRGKNLPAVVDWLPEGPERDWLRDWLSADLRKDRIAGMEELAAAGEWHDLSCHLSGWHDDLQTMQLIYARWDADAPRRNARKPRQGKEWWRVLADYLHKDGPETWDAKFAHLPDEDEDGLKLGDGKYEFNRRIGENRDGKKVTLVSCSFGGGKKPDEISWATFEKYLKEMKPR